MHKFRFTNGFAAMFSTPSSAHFPQLPPHPSLPHVFLIVLQTPVSLLHDFEEHFGLQFSGKQVVPSVEQTCCSFSDLLLQTPHVVLTQLEGPQYFAEHCNVHSGVNFNESL